MKYHLRPGKRNSLSAAFWVMSFIGGWTLICAGLATAATPACQSVLPPVTRNALEVVLWEMTGSISPAEQRQLAVAEIQADIRSALARAGISTQLVTRQKAITRSRFLKIRLYRILLERRVYYCSAEILEQSPSHPICRLKEYSQVADRPEQIRPLINNLIKQILRDIPSP